MRGEKVIGFTLSEARNMLTDAGVKVASIRVTSPPKAELMDIDGYYRVINVIDKGEEGIELIICKPL